MSILFDILSTGSILFIVSCGLLLILGVMKIFNFAHGGRPLVDQCIHAGHDFWHIPGEPCLVQRCPCCGAGSHKRSCQSHTWFADDRCVGCRGTSHPSGGVCPWLSRFLPLSMLSVNDVEPPQSAVRINIIPPDGVEVLQAGFKTAALPINLSTDEYLHSGTRLFRRCSSLGNTSYVRRNFPRIARLRKPGI